MTKTVFYGIMTRYQGDVPFWAHWARAECKRNGRTGLTAPTPTLFWFTCEITTR